MKKFLSAGALALAALTATIAAVPGTASAAVRTGSVQDPQGDVARSVDLCSTSSPSPSL